MLSHGARQRPLGSASLQHLEERVVSGLCSLTKVGTEVPMRDTVFAGNISDGSYGILSGIISKQTASSQGQGGCRVRFHLLHRTWENVFMRNVR